MQGNWVELDIFLRGGAVTALLACAAVFAFRHTASRKSISLVSFCTSLCCYLVVSSPAIPVSGSMFALILVALAGLVPVLGYWASLELFLDDAGISRWQVAAALVVVAGAWLPEAVPFAELARGAAAIVLFGHLMFVVLAGGEDDLVEVRRSFRRWFLLTLAAVAIVIIVLEVSGQDTDLPAWAFALHAAVFNSLALAFLVWAFRPMAAVWPPKPERKERSAGHSPACGVLAGRARAAMEDGAWQEENLTISKLAARLGTQEHRLRRAINRQLGFRNFPSFVNTYRIKAAKQLLSDPMKADQPIQSIAYDVGFSSIGPFNRAFRASEGMAPSEFRKRSLAGGF